MSVTPESLLESLRGKGLLTLRKVCFETSRTLSPEQTFRMAQVLYQYEDPTGAMAAALLAGHVSYIIPAALQFLRETVAGHTNIKVQDCLAKALDHYCLNRGYDRAFPVLQDWGRDPREFARRAALEAPRPWLRKDFFVANIKDVLEFVLTLKDDPSPFVRFSVSNVIAEMRRDNPGAIGPHLIKLTNFQVRPDNQAPE